MESAENQTQPVASSAPKVPYAMEDESGGRWWIEGHGDPAAAVLAVFVHTVLDVGVDEAMCFLFDGETGHKERLAKVDELLSMPTQLWMRCEPDDELMVRTDASDPYGLAYTLIDPT